MFFGLPFSIAIFYIVALAIALLKDILDLAFIGSLPGIGSVLTFIFSLGILVLILLAGLFSAAMQGNKIKKIGGIIKRILILTGGTGAEELFGLNLLPWETGAVIFIAWMHGREYKKAKKNANK